MEVVASETRKVIIVVPTRTRPWRRCRGVPFLESACGLGRDNDERAAEEACEQCSRMPQPVDIAAVHPLWVTFS
jgi:hypothetical protein